MASARTGVRRHSLLPAYIAGFLSVLLVPLIIVGVVWYQQSTTGIFDDVFQLNRERLERTVREFERMFGDLRNASSLMSVNRRLRPRFIEENPINAMEAMEVLGYYDEREAAVAHVILSFRADDAVYTADARFQEGFFLENELRIDPSQYYRVRSVLREPDVTRIETGLLVGTAQSRERAMMFVSPVSTGIGSPPYGVIAYVIPESALRSQLSRVAGLPDGMLTVLDADGGVVFQFGTSAGIAASDTTDGASMLARTITLRSTFPQFEYRYDVPAPTYLDRLKQLRSLMLVVFSASLLVGGGLAVYLAYRNYRPIRALADSAVPARGAGQVGFGGNELEMISAALEEAHERVDEITERHAGQAAMATQTLLAALLRRAPTETDYGEVEALGLPRRISSCVVALVTLRSARRQGMMSDRERLLNLAVNTDAPGWQIYPVELLYREGLALVAVRSVEEAAGTDSEEVRRMIAERLVAGVSAEGIVADVSVGDLYDDWSGVHSSFLDAISAIDVVDGSASDGYTLYDGADTITENDEVPWFPARLVDRVIRSIELRSSSLVDKSITELSEAIRRHDRSPVVGRAACVYAGANIAAALVSAFGSEATGHIDRLVAASDAESLAKALRAATGVVSLDRSDMAQGDEALSAAILECIGERYLDPNFSLVALADQFRVSIYYMSRYFQREFGVKFSDYLRAQRLKEAERLLLDSDRNVGAIAGDVCYQNSSHFIRSFKAEHGVTPAVYREQNRPRRATGG